MAAIPHMNATLGDLAKLFNATSDLKASNGSLMNFSSSLQDRRDEVTAVALTMTTEYVQNSSDWTDTITNVVIMIFLTFVILKYVRVSNVIKVFTNTAQMIRDRTNRDTQSSPSVEDDEEALVAQPSLASTPDQDSVTSVIGHYGSRELKSVFFLPENSHLSREVLRVKHEQVSNQCHKPVSNRRNFNNQCFEERRSSKFDGKSKSGIQLVTSPTVKHKIQQSSYLNLQDSLPLLDIK